jgi:hypothetical protein
MFVASQEADESPSATWSKWAAGNEQTEPYGGSGAIDETDNMLDLYPTNVENWLIF